MRVVSKLLQAHFSQFDLLDHTYEVVQYAIALPIRPTISSCGDPLTLRYRAILIFSHMRRLIRPFLPRRSRGLRASYGEPPGSPGPGPAAANCGAAVERPCGPVAPGRDHQASAIAAIDRFSGSRGQPRLRPVLDAAAVRRDRRWQ